MRVLTAVLTVILAGCAPPPGERPAGRPNSLADRREIWTRIQPLAARQHLDPGFVYALVKAESGFDPHAARGEARGLLQIKPPAWLAASTRPYQPEVWDVGTNLTVGIELLGALKTRMETQGTFSYPMLWASYHYGYDFVAARGFDRSRIPRPADPVSYRLWSGEVRPVPAP